MRFGFGFLLLALVACDSDTFVAPDTGVEDAGKEDVVSEPDADHADAPSEVGLPDVVIVGDSSSGDASIHTHVVCGSGKSCDDQICCGGALAWGGPYCGSVSAEGVGLCTNWLACDDRADCPSGDYCCATQKMVSGEVVNSSYCAPNCFATQGAFVVCSQTSDCPTGTCQAYVGDPGWAKSCQ
ncbi:MAG TPA: hypothetical protein VGH28_28310 [Polyangiaceae bacterium]|jgi:hypothetical protein